MREEAIADLSSRSGGELRQCEECGAMRAAAGDTNHKEFSRQVVVNITALLPTGRRYHHRLGRRSPHSLPSSKPAGEQRGGEQPGRRSLEGVGGVQGFLGKFFGLLLFKEYILNFSCAVVWPAFANVPSFSRVDWGGTS